MSAFPVAGTVCDMIKSLTQELISSSELPLSSRKQGPGLTITSEVLAFGMPSSVFGKSLFAIWHLLRLKPETECAWALSLFYLLGHSPNLSTFSCFSQPDAGVAPELTCSRSSWGSRSSWIQEGGLANGSLALARAEFLFQCLVTWDR